jgi:hypothetical protein
MVAAHSPEANWTPLSEVIIAGTPNRATPGRYERVRHGGGGDAAKRDRLKPAGSPVHGGVNVRETLGRSWEGAHQVHMYMREPL